MTMVVTAPARAASVRKVTSPGGVEAWLVEDHTNPLIAIQFAFTGGSSQDPAAKPGLAYLMSGMLDEGAGPYDSTAFHERVEDLAIDLRFDADRDYVTGSLKTLTKNCDEAFELLRLALQEPRFDQDAVERVKAQVLAGLRRDANEPNAVARNAFAEAAFPNHPYGWPLKGTLEGVPTITGPDLDAYRRKTLDRAGLKVAVVGDIDAARLAQILDRIFAGLPARAELRPVADVVMASGQRRSIDLPVPQSTIIFGLPGLARKDADYVPAVVMNHILGGGTFTSRLWTEIREKRGLAYSVYSSLSPFRHSALLFGATSTKNERANESISVISAEIEAFARDNITADELDKAKKYLTGSYGLRFDTSTKIARELLQAQLDDLGMDYFDRRNAEIAAVTADDIARVSKRLLDTGKMLVVIVGRPVG
ncbi:zinc protease [Rhizobiales bacterium GAS191]|jgi:zinc protease|nr:zinc protease [Rhizobiales bacterium GAS113]SEE49412.1 zinc protease [Rhizobiales bacterium GAS191]